MMKKGTVFFMGVVMAGLLLAAQAYASAAEYARNYGMALVGVQAAHNAGYKGAGVVIGVVDGGVLTTHREFQTESGSKIITRHDMTSSPGNNNHGTHVVGIIAANLDDYGMVGYAPEASLITVTVFNSAGTSVADPDKANLWLSATQAQIINNSWGVVDAYDKTIQITDVTQAWIVARYDINAYKTAVQRGKIIVFSAGNSGFANVGVEAGLPYYYPELKPYWVAVVAVDETGAIAAYSERCGVASDWCIAAPGGSELEGYYSTTAGTDSSYGYMYGTSMAAPAVSGTLAIVLGRYPFLTGAQAIEVVFGTANQGIVNGVDYSDSSIYGHGLLDVEAASKGPGRLLSDFTVDTKGYTETFENDISGNYKFTKTGAGTLYLSGQNTYTGNTSVTGGALMLDGAQLTSAVEVSANATFGGSGVVTKTVTNHGTVYVTQTLRVDSYNQTLRGTLAIDNSSSLLSVDNAATIKGDLKLLSAFPIGTHTILTAGTLSGTFAFDPNDYAFMSPTISYTGNQVQVTITDIETFDKLAGMDGNQRNVARALNQYAALNPSDTRVLYLQALSTDDASLTFSEIAGTITPNTVQMILPTFGQARSLLYQRLGSQAKRPLVVKEARVSNLAQNNYYHATDIPLYRERNSAYRAKRNVSPYAPSAWGEIFVTRGQYKKDDNIGTVEDEKTGGIVGADRHLSRKLKAGLFLAYMTGEMTEEKTTAKTDSDTFIGGVYSSYVANAADVYLTVAGFYQRNDTKRTLSVFNEGAKGSFATYGAFVDAEPGLRYRIDETTIGRLVVGGTAGIVRQEAYSESGDAGWLLLDMDGGTNAFVELRAGGTLDGLAANGRLGWNLQGYVKWRAVGAQPETTGTFQGTAISFDVKAAEISPVVLSGGGGVSYAVNRNAEIGLQGLADVGDKEFAYTVGGFVKIRF